MVSLFELNNSTTNQLKIKTLYNFDVDVKE